MIPGVLARQGWTAWHWAAAAALLAAGVAVTLGAWRDIGKIAADDAEQSHVILVPIVAAWMLWSRRVRLRHCPPSGEWIGPLMVAAGWALSWFGYHHMVQAAWHMGAVMIVVGAPLTVLGKNVVFNFLPAFLVLIFLVPVPSSLRQFIAVPLQTYTAAVTEAILETFSFSLERAGNVLTINGAEVAVAEACNGMRMVFALILVSYAFAFGLPLRNSARVVVLLASPVAALICNVIRLLPTVLLYGYADRNVASLFHDASGWLMLPVAFLLLLGVLRVLKWALIPVNRFTLAYQ